METENNILTDVWFSSQEQELVFFPNNDNQELSDTLRSGVISAKSDVINNMKHSTLPIKFHSSAKYIVIPLSKWGIRDIYVTLITSAGDCLTDIELPVSIW